ncbi:MAG TPA: hypothetical protein VHB79_16800 [Polyangiaceae bacterium]|nr:hypothetical protein [Polyangiaceae bacterium]
MQGGQDNSNESGQSATHVGGNTSEMNAGAGGEPPGVPSAGASFQRLVPLYYGQINFSKEAPIACQDDHCPSGQRCFRITSDLGICGAAAIPEATQCDIKSSPIDPPDECGCDGLTCSAEQRCRAVENLCSCAPTHSNRCVDAPCELPTDCGEDVCVPSQYILDSRCFTPECRSDADCQSHPGMHCVAMYGLPPQAGEVTFNGTKCVYNERPPLSASCNEVVQYWSDAFACVTQP